MSGMGGFKFKGCGGGVVVFWDNRVLQLEEMEVGNYSISCRFKNVEDGFCWVFSGVYGPSVKVEKEEFLSELGAIKGLWNDPWCVAGDFNMIRFPTERSRGGRLSPSMRRFTEVIEELELGSSFPGVYSSVLARPVSDHSPIILDGGGMTRGPTPFRFENMWLKEEGFKEVLRRWWEEIQISGTASYILSEKLKALKPTLKKWNTEVFGQIKVKKQEAWNSLDFWDKEERVRELSLKRKKLGRRQERCIRRAAGRPGGVEAQDRRFGRLKGWKRGCGGAGEAFHGGGGVLAKVISTAQNAFVEGRQIMDAVLVANEAIDSIVKSNRGAILCKLDIEKAYDHVDWDFLLAVMEKMGFGERWCRWIKWCLSTVRYSVLVNGSPTGFFQSFKGVKARRPFVAVPFCSGDGGFQCFDKKGSGWGVLAPCLIRGRRGEGVQISHLLFADDTLIFCEAKEEQLLVENVDELADEFGYRVGKLPSTYLGMPLDKRSGGLGVKNLGAFNRALLGKWVWRFANERKALWNQVIRGKYGEERGGWRSCDGEKVKFWKDKWCETIPLSEVFPSLFALASNKEAWINEVWTAGGKGGEFGTLVSIDLSTIGRWKMLSGYFVA
ncbi:hypothetical protein CK203_015858 [Vitis vinifera]|uniref:Reverse transcriptase domain-containing protein n=1 Tax=Vitis vinifera TaxID=29760 RepID=A0A438JRA4_VITVI|nr:hypothetical protein CK203_015858 [Vitis vinifera]